MQASEYHRLYEAEDSMWWFRSLHAMLLKLLPNPARTGAALDLGCGTGGWLQNLQAQNYSTTGLDFSTIALGLANRRKKLDLVEGSANTLPFQSETFDLVTCIDVLEVATIEPKLLITEAVRVLRSGGSAIFVAAAHQWLMSEHDRAVNSVRRFELSEFRDLFAINGITIMRSSYLFFLLFPFVVLRKVLNRQRSSRETSVSDVSSPPAILNAALIGLCWLEAQWLSVGKLPAGSSVAVLVKKNE